MKPAFDSGAAYAAPKTATMTAARQGAQPADQRPPEPNQAQLAREAQKLGLTVRQFRDEYLAGAWARYGDLD